MTYTAEIEENVVKQVQQRMAALLRDNNITEYRQHETFRSNSNKEYQFLIWKYQPKNFDDLLNNFCKEVESLIKEQAYKTVAGANSMSSYDKKTNQGYQLTALYKPD